MQRRKEMTKHVRPAPNMFAKQVDYSFKPSRQMMDQWIPARTEPVRMMADPTPAAAAIAPLVETEDED
jgi:hypothetical protein